MAIDSWNEAEDRMIDRAMSALRSVLIALAWILVIAGPPVAGGVLGWLATADGRGVSAIVGLLGQLPADAQGEMISRAEIEAVGLDPKEVEAILTH